MIYRMWQINAAGQYRWTGLTVVADSVDEAIKLFRQMPGVPATITARPYHEA